MVLWYQLETDSVGNRLSRRSTQSEIDSVDDSRQSDGSKSRRGRRLLDVLGGFFVEGGLAVGGEEVVPLVFEVTGQDTARGGVHLRAADRIGGEDAAATRGGHGRVQVVVAAAQVIGQVSVAAAAASVSGARAASAGSGKTCDGTLAGAEAYFEGLAAKVFLQCSEQK